MTLGNSCSDKLSKKKRRMLDKMDCLRLRLVVCQDELDEAKRKDEEKKLTENEQYQRAIKRIQDFLKPFRTARKNDFIRGSVKEIGELFLKDMEALYAEPAMKKSELVQVAWEVAELADSVKVANDIWLDKLTEKQRKAKLKIVFKQIDQRHKLVEDRATKLEGDRPSTRRLGRVTQVIGYTLLILGVLTAIAAVFLPLTFPITAAIWAGLAAAMGIAIGGFCRSDGRNVAKANARTGLPRSLCLFGDVISNCGKRKQLDELGIKEEVRRACR